MPSGVVPHNQPCLLVCCLIIGRVGVQWLSGRVLDSRPRGGGFEPHQRHCVVVFDFLFIVTPIVGVCNCSMFCCTLLYVHSSIAIILMGKRELIALLNLSFWCLVMVERLFLAVPRGCLQFVIVVFPDHTHILFLSKTHLS